MFGFVFSVDLLKSASIAYIHYLSFMLCFGALIYERISLKPSPNRQESICMILADVIYGIAGIALLVSGIYRVIKFGQGSEFYTQNVNWKPHIKWRLKLAFQEVVVLMFLLLFNIPKFIFSFILRAWSQVVFKEHHYLFSFNICCINNVVICYLLSKSLKA